MTSPQVYVNVNAFVQCICIGVLQDNAYLTLTVPKNYKTSIFTNASNLVKILRNKKMEALFCGVARLIVGVDVTENDGKEV